MFNKLYWFFSYLGLMVLAASFVMGCRYEAGAPVGNILFNLGLYAIYIAVHIVMTLPAFKRAVFGHVEGTPAERRIYVTISILTWVGVYAFHQPVPGFAVNAVCVPALGCGVL